MTIQQKKELTDYIKIASLFITAAGICLTFIVKGSEVVSVVSRQNEAILNLKIEGERINTAVNKMQEKQENDKVIISNHETRISNAELRINYLIEKPQSKRYYSR